RGVCGGPAARRPAPRGGVPLGASSPPPHRPRPPPPAAHRWWPPEIARKDGYLLRLAKAAINGIDPVDVHRSYRFEQGFTFEANLSGVADRVRDTFGTEQHQGAK
ncbi:hypothetical protein ACFW1M_35175, partial [Streptomyces inhibens]